MLTMRHGRMVQPVDKTPLGSESQTAFCLQADAALLFAEAAFYLLYIFALFAVCKVRKLFHICNCNFSARKLNHAFRLEIPEHTGDDFACGT